MREENSGYNFLCQGEYWKKEFEGEIPVLDMPYDYVRPQEQSHNGDTIEQEIDKGLSDKIRDTAKKYGVTEYMVFLTGLMITLGKYSRQEDIIIGSPVSGRVNGDTEKMLGMFVNTLAMRGRPERGKTCEEFMGEIKETCLKAYENQEYPFEELVEEVKVERDMSRNPLFDVMLTYQNTESVSYNLQGCKIEQILVKDNTSKLDLSFVVMEEGGVYSIGLEYCTDLFNKESAENILKHYKEVLVQILENSEKKIEEIEVLTEEERELIENHFNNTYKEYDRTKTVVDLFEEQVEKTPDNIAIVFGEEEITYRELNEKSNQLAARLMEKGVGAEDFVAMITERSIEMIVGIYGILKAGGAYVPMDSEYPEERIRYMLEDCGAKVMVTTGKGKLPENIDIDEIDLYDKKIYTGVSKNPERVSGPENLAYCIYTSGTTGKPKGVMIEHHSLVNFVSNNVINSVQYSLINNCKAVVSSNKYIFDITVHEIFLPLSYAKTIILLEEVLENFSEKDIHNIRKLGKVGFITTPTKISCINIEILKELNEYIRVIMIGAEKLPSYTVNSLKKMLCAEIFNGYGPTEATCGVTYYNCQNIIENVPIGKPISNTKIYIMNEEKQCGIGVPGELCIIGEGLARGYLHKKGLTDEKFEKNPYGKGRMYRTGDLARWIPDGNIEYLGRIDNQVKIRGFRIELGEIESRLRENNKVKEAAVIAREQHNGETLINAYIVSEIKIDILELREELKKVLPEYMVPQYMMQIDRIPITRNGKLDKKQLPIIKIEMSQYKEPKTQEEKMLIKCCEEVLNISCIGLNENFFDIGGDSIKTLKLVSKMREYRYKLTVTDVMKFQVIEKIAKIVRKIDVSIYSQDEVSGVIQPTPILKRFNKWNLKEPNHFNQSVLLNVDSSILDIIEEVINILIKHHDILRATYKNEKLFIRTIDDFGKLRLKVYNVEENDETKEIIEKKCNEIQKSIKLDNGSLIKVALFNVKDQSILFICIHHLIIDAVSWEILISDFKLILEQKKKGMEIKLPLKTASFIEWSEMLAKYRNTIQVEEKKQQWLKIISKMKDGNLQVINEKRGKGYSNTEIVLNREITMKLLNNANIVYGTRTEELVLAALGITVNMMTKQSYLNVGIESNGRAKLHMDIDVDRTIGWFTSLYPIVIECINDIDRSVISVKEICRKVTNCGIEYGLLFDENSEVSIDIFFNYIGEILQNDNINKKFSFGDEISHLNKLISKIVITCEVVNNCMNIGIVYDKEFFSMKIIEEFKKIYMNNLKKIVNRLCNINEIHKTASDYDSIDLNMNELDEIRKLFNSF